MEFTAAQHAMQLPEIVSLILAACEFDLPWERAAVARCARISRVWYNHAVPILWSQLGHVSYPLDTINPSNYFNAISDLARRQFYANFVISALLCTSNREGALEEEDKLSGLDFPRLTHLMIVAVAEGPTRLPRIQAMHRVVSLEIAVTWPEEPGEIQTAWRVRAVLEQIPVSLRF